MQESFLKSVLSIEPKNLEFISKRPKSLKRGDWRRAPQSMLTPSHGEQGAQGTAQVSIVFA